MPPSENPRPADSKKILIVDDHPLVLHGLAAALASHGHAVAGVASLDEAERALADGCFDVLLLDFNLQQDRGTDLLARAGVRLPPWVVLLSGVTDQEDVVQAFEQGVHVFVSKTVNPDALVLALESLGQVAPRRGEGLVWSVEQGRFTPYAESFSRASLLSGKERDVFMLLRQGLLDKQIAGELGISIHTVRVHIRSIKRKRELHRRGDRL